MKLPVDHSKFPGQFLEYFRERNISEEAQKFQRKHKNKPYAQ